jgi:hypothetical protein
MFLPYCSWQIVMQAPALIGHPAKRILQVSLSLLSPTTESLTVSVALAGPRRNNPQNRSKTLKMRYNPTMVVDAGDSQLYQDSTID